MNDGDKQDSYFNKGEDFSKYLQHSKQPEVEKIFLHLLDSGCPIDNVLDIGCASGRTTAFTKRHGVRELVGIEIDPRGAEIAEQHFDRVIVGDASTLELDYPPEYFDLLFFTDILEHLVDPWSSLERYLAHLKPGGRVVIVLPNAAHISLIGGLLLGNYEYQQEGLLDWGHLRFFTKYTASKMIKNAGLEIGGVVSRSEEPRYRPDGSVEIIGGDAMTLHFDSSRIPREVRDAWFVLKYHFWATKPIGQKKI